MERMCRRLYSQVASGVSSANVRKTFLDYFQKNHDHVFVPSSSTMPGMDYSVPFVNSGMLQFKQVFSGLATIPHKRVVNSQKCIRIKGKFDDSDLVGHDGVHHTFFEMLGNWSFGDYYKKEACAMSWELLTKVYGIPVDRLYVTYFNGDQGLGLEPDLETAEIWRELGVDKDRILPFGLKNNFWENDIGPCGPCTEIHYDRGGGPDAKSMVNAGTEDVVELWNIVFLGYLRERNNTLVKLKRTFVDTGMGLERLVAVLQGKRSNYDTDLFAPLMDAISKITGAPPYGTSEELDYAYRLVADHARMLTVVLSDGMLPNTHTRIRAAFLKAQKQALQSFGNKTDLIKKLTNHVAEILSPVYPEIGRNLQRVQTILDQEVMLRYKREEETVKEYLALVERYPGIEKVEVHNTMAFLRGFSYIENNIIAKQKDLISGQHAWELKSTYGMDSKTMKMVAEVLGLKFDKHVNMEANAQTEKVKRNEKFEKKLAIHKRLSQMEVPPTDDSFRSKCGHDGNGNYTFAPITTKIVAILVDYEPVESVDIGSLNETSNVGLIFDRTNLFGMTWTNDGESGTFCIGNDLKFDISMATRLFSYVVHWGRFHSDGDGSWTVSVNQEGRLAFNESARVGLMRAYTSGHIFDAVLRKKIPLYTENQMKIGCDELTTSFWYYSSQENVKNKVLREIEEEVMNIVRSGAKVRTEMYPFEEACRLENVTLGRYRSYSEKVPVVEISNSEGVISRKLCDGVHVSNTSHVQGFVISEKSFVSYREKQLKAVTGMKAFTAWKNAHSVLRMFAEINSSFEDSSDHSSSSDEEQLQRNLYKKIENSIRWTKNGKNPLPCYIRSTLVSRGNNMLEKIEMQMSKKPSRASQARE